MTTKKYDFKSSHATKAIADIKAKAIPGAVVRKHDIPMGQGKTRERFFVFVVKES
jgi:hypothetical protein